MKTMDQYFWLEALTAKSVWSRSLRTGIPVGLLQIVVNQGDFWLRHQVSWVVVVKSIITPMIAISVCLISTAGLYVDQKREKIQ